jgi:hypothetical protein
MVLPQLLRNSFRQGNQSVFANKQQPKRIVGVFVLSFTHQRPPPV